MTANALKALMHAFASRKVSWQSEVSCEDVRIWGRQTKAACPRVTAGCLAPCSTHGQKGDSSSNLQISTGTMRVYSQEDGTKVLSVTRCNQGTAEDHG